MKKLMIALAAVAMAACSQAASIKWTTDVIYGANADGSFTSTYLSKSTGISNFSVALTFFDAAGNEITSVTGTSATTSSSKNGKASGNTDGFDFIVDTDYQYAAHYSMTMGGKEYTMDVGPTTFTQTQGTGAFALTVPTAGKWETAAVPEPTSGLLLLLGVAGLALKRRRV